MNPEEINPSAAPSGDGCLECDADGGWRVHLLAPPLPHPDAQSVPGPADRVPADWQGLLEQGPR